MAIGLSGLLFAASHLHSWELREVIGLLGYLGSGLVYSGLFLKPIEISTFPASSTFLEIAACSLFTIYNNEETG